MEKAREGYFDRDIVAGRVGHTSSLCITKEEEKYIPELDIDLDEADGLLALHARQAVAAGASRIVVLTCDSDVVVLMAYHFAMLHTEGLQELRVNVGIGATERYISVHRVVFIFGAEVCRFLPAVHALSGCEYTSKVGTKSAALRASPETYLKDFAETSNIEEREQQMR